jgi:tRNA/rRNA methyltransferase
LVLVRPEQGRNVGAAARAAANMGIQGSFRIVGTPEILDEESHRVAKHARGRFEEIQYFPTLEAALSDFDESALKLAATARIGSSSRPHPLRVRSGVERAVQKLRSDEIRDLVFVFGPESDGLANEDVDQCDWVVTSPSCPEYRSLNLAQAILVFCYEANLNLMAEWEPLQKPRPSQKQKLVTHILRCAEAVGFVLPGDPFKMRPRLEEILSPLPNHIEGIKTLHGLLDQIIRSVEKGRPDIKGRFKPYYDGSEPIEEEARK